MLTRTIIFDILILVAKHRTFSDSSIQKEHEKKVLDKQEIILYTNIVTLLRNNKLKAWTLKTEQCKEKT